MTAAGTDRLPLSIEVTGRLAWKKGKVQGLTNICLLPFLGLEHN
jgi:hypothetical protein